MSDEKLLPEHLLPKRSTPEKLLPGHTHLTPAERSARAKLAANARWARTRDRTAATQAMRDGLLARFMTEVDPDETLPIDERRKLAENARNAHLAKMRFEALKAKRAAAGGQ